MSAAEPKPEDEASTPDPGDGAPVAPHGATATKADAPKPESLEARTKRRPLLGTSLWVLGAVLWGHAVMAPFVADTRYVPEPMGVAALFVIFALALRFAYKRSGAPRFGLRQWVPAPIAVASLFVAYVAAGFGRGRGTGAVFLVLGAVLVLVGRPLTGPRPKPEGVSRGRRVLGVLSWVVAVGISLLMIAVHADNF